MSYLDTSVLTAYYCPEAHSAKVQRLLTRLENPTISPLVEIELHCAVARKVRAGGMEGAAARRIFAEFEAHLAQSRFNVVPIQAAEYSLACRWIEELPSPLRALDALHLAAAFTNDLVLVTADKSLAASAGHFGVKHRLAP
jgi:hypothetical protein